MGIPTRILVPTDFSAGSKNALRLATELAKACRSEIVLMHAIEPFIFAISPLDASEKPDHGAWREKVESELERWAGEVKNEHRIPTKHVVRTGRAFQEIVRAAKDLDADLIVMGSAGYAAGTYALLGSTAERVARKASCPVLLAREKGVELG